MRNHMQSILHTAAIFGAVGMIFTAISATRHWVAEDKHLQAETAFFQQQTEENRTRFEDARKARMEGQKQQALAFQAERIEQTQKQKEERERRDNDEKVAAILANMEIGRRICLHSHKETWWFVCYEQDDKGQNIPNTTVPCEEATRVCDQWAVRKGLESKGEKTWRE